MSAYNKEAAAYELEQSNQEPQDLATSTSTQQEKAKKRGFNPVKVVTKSSQAVVGGVVGGIGQGASAVRGGISQGNLATYYWKRDGRMKGWLTTGVYVLLTEQWAAHKQTVEQARARVSIGRTNMSTSINHHTITTTNNNNDWVRQDTTVDEGSKGCAWIRDFRD